MMDWMPIDSAPKDGSWVLGFFPDLMQQAMCIRWDAPSSHYLPHWNAGKLCVYDPTHWMPLPEPPK